MAVKDQELIYLYCVAEQAPVLSEKAPSVTELRAVAYRDLYAVVSNVSALEFNEEALPENLKNPAWLKQKVLLHEDIIENVMEKHTIAPFKFATLFRNQHSLSACLDRHYVELKAALANFKGREEWGVKVYCQSQKLQRALASQDETLSNLERQASEAGQGTAFLLRKQREDLLRVLLDRKLLEYSQDCFERLSAGSIQARLNTPLPEAATPQQGAMILNAAFLIPASKHSVLMGAVSKLRVAYEDQGLRLDCTGPWPPYNFCQFSKESLAHA